MRLAIAVIAFAAAGCASQAPVNIGGDTYYAAKTNAAGGFGSVTAVAGELMQDGGKFCAGMGKKFELVTQNTEASAPGRLGGANITFRCADSTRDPVMRPDQGVTTIERR